MASEEDRESHVCIAKPAEQPERDDCLLNHPFFLEWHLIVRKEGLCRFKDLHLQ